MTQLRVAGSTASRLSCALLLLAACAHGPAGVPSLPRPAPAETVDDALHGLRFELPPVEGGWKDAADGSRLSAHARLEIGSFPLARAGDGVTCRETARKRLAVLQRVNDDEDASHAEKQPRAEGPRDESTADLPVASWSFTRGTGGAAVRSRWAFLSRGADCLMLQVTGPLGAKEVDEVFDDVAGSARATELPADRQRQIDVLAGMGFLQQRDPTSALERFDALAQREPDFGIAHYGALMAAFELGPTAYGRGLPHGEALLRTNRELSPDQRQLALSAIGVMQLEQNQPKLAARTFAELVVRAPELAEGQYNYACALARLGDEAGALEHLKAAFALDKSLAAHADKDEDLASLRSKPGFTELLRRAQGQ